MKAFGHLALALLLALGVSAPAAAQSGGDVSSYWIPGVFEKETRSAIAATGAAIVEVGPDYVLVTTSATTRATTAPRRTARSSW